MIGGSDIIILVDFLRSGHRSSQNEMSNTQTGKTDPGSGIEKS